MENTKFVKLKTTQLPKMLADLTHSNQFLKVFTLASLVLTILMLFAVIFMATKEPTVITLNVDGKNLEKTLLPKAEDQIREGIKKYLEKRYQWEPENVIKKLKESEEFITPTSLKAFQSAVSNVASFQLKKLFHKRSIQKKLKLILKNKLLLSLATE